MSLLSSLNLSKTQDVLSSIDAIITAVEKFPEDDCKDVYLGLSPFALLLLILKSFGIQKEELIQWLTNFIKYELPVIELGVKGILLTNLKEMIDCSVDPRIPAYARLGDDEEINSGITFDLSTIDSQGLLANSPLSYEGETMYFGTTGCTSPYDFLRAKDFDAFLWLVTHKSKFPNHTRINEISDLETLFNGYLNNFLGSETLLDVVKLSYDVLDETKNSGILPGASFKQRDFKLISVCSEAPTSMGKISTNTITPIGEFYDRINWYVNRKHYFDFLLPDSDRADNINHNEDVGLFSIKYIDEIADDGKISDDSVYLTNKINIKILRKPEKILDGLVLKKLVFNSKGEEDLNGRFTTTDVTKCTKGGNGKFTCPLEYLCECYSNETIYAFNYDYIFGMKLFDAKVVVTQLINSLLGLKIGVSGQLLGSLSNNQIESQERIVDIVKKIVEANDYESSDCFFSFSNEEIEEQTRNADLKKSNLVKFGDSQTTINEEDVEDIIALIKEYDEAKQEGSVDAFKRLMEKVEVTISEPKNENNDSKLSFNTKLGLDIIEQFIQNLVMILVNAFLSPKVILMIAMNQKLCGKYTKDNFNIEQLLNQMIGLITSIVKEIRDLILQQLLKLVMKKMGILLLELSEKLILEQILIYKKLLKQLIDACWFWSHRRSLLDTKLDEVDYADIDDVNKQPNTEKC